MTATPISMKALPRCRCAWARRSRSSGRSSAVPASLGEDVHAHLIRFYERELEAYEKECVTDWEFFRYFERI